MSLLRTAARTRPLVLALSLASLAGCSSTAAPDAAADAAAEGASTSCPTADADAGCGWTDDELRACAAPGSGLYGAASWSCSASPTYCGGVTGGCLDSGTVGATLPDGGALSVALGAGRYALSLPAGSYDVCYTAAGGAQGCTHVDLAEGQLQRVDVAGFLSAGTPLYQLTPK
jgi:hypothetical protein